MDSSPITSALAGSSSLRMEGRGLRQWLSSRFLRFLLAPLLVFCFFAGCQSTQPTLVVVVGGLGFSQLGDLRQAVKEQCPHATVVSAGAWDGYKADIKSIATSNQHQRIVLVGHSLGCEAVAKAAAELPRVDLTIFIDPSWDDFKLPQNTSGYLWYQRSQSDIEREAKIIGASNARTIEGDHNGIPHSAELIAEVVAAINKSDAVAVSHPPRPNAKAAPSHYALVSEGVATPQRTQRTAAAAPR